LATWFTGRAGLERYAAGALPVTDDRPRIEYASWVRRGEITKTLPALLALRTSPPLSDAEAPFQSEVAERREQLLVFYAAGLAAYKGDRDRWAQAIDRAIGSGSRNPYYRWIVGQVLSQEDSSRSNS
jgi:spermidine synthase